MSILVVGTVAFDTIETPFGRAEQTVGGAATYICLAASFYSKKLNLVSVVGGDFPESATNILKSKLVNIKGLQIKKEEKTFFWSGKYHDNMNSRDTLETQLNVLEGFNPAVPKEYKNAEFLMLGNLMPSIQKQVLDQMTKKPKMIILDTMNFWMDNFMQDLKSSLKEVDLLTINDEEARQLSGEYSLITAARKILKMGPKHLIIKKGEHGALLFAEKQAFYVPAIPVERVVDPTGAGDSFAGGLIGYLAKTKDTSFENIKRAVVQGTVMASFCVQKFGIEGLVGITQRDILARTKELVELVKFAPELK